ncbi:hypothetical protein ACOJB1_07150 [Enterococcus innesii]|uniref:hypothetical protein n=1 Tax=Enterococcus innesii TaxID=2839759 RepID=UPI003B59B3CA
MSKATQFPSKISFGGFFPSHSHKDQNQIDQRNKEGDTPRNFVPLDFCLVILIGMPRNLRGQKVELFTTIKYPAKPNSTAKASWLIWLEMT